LIVINVLNSYFFNYHCRWHFSTSFNYLPLHLSF